jgi:hypothetical protein
MQPRGLTHMLKTGHYFLMSINNQEKFVHRKLAKPCNYLLKYLYQISIVSGHVYLREQYFSYIHGEEYFINIYKLCRNEAVDVSTGSTTIERVSSSFPQKMAHCEDNRLFRIFQISLSRAK